jgi:hypothetical protein
MNWISFNIKFIVRNKLVNLQIINVVIFYSLLSLVCLSLDKKTDIISQYVFIFSGGLASVLPLSYLWFLIKKYHSFVNIIPVNFVWVSFVYLLTIWSVNLVCALLFGLIFFKSFDLVLLALFTNSICSLLTILIGYLNKFSHNLNSLFNSHFNYSGIVIIIPLLLNNKLMVLSSFILHKYSQVSFLMFISIIYLVCSFTYFYLTRQKS